MAHKPAMAATKRIFGEMKQYELSGEPPSQEILKEWKNVVKIANAEVSRLAKLANHHEERHAVDCAVLSEEMRSELVDREANTARTSERFRVMHDKVGSLDCSYDKAMHSASLIESSIALLCAHPLNRSGGSRLLYEKSNV
jgi:hypothetical protein